MPTVYKSYSPHTGKQLVCLNGLLAFNAQLSSRWVVTFLSESTELGIKNKTSEHFYIY